MAAEQGDLLTIRQVADVFQVTPQTVKKYIYEGRLPSVRTPGGHHRIRRSDVEGFLRGGLASAILEPSVSREGLVEVVRALVRLMNSRPREKAVRDALSGVVGSLVRIIEELYDTFEPGHGERVAGYAGRLAGELGMPDGEGERLRLAALLHDVGKLMLDRRVLKKRGRLTPSEYGQVKLHPVYGEEILSGGRELTELSKMIRHHHERRDGSGYPDGLSGADIPMPAQILSIAESYDSMRSRSAYREGMTHVRAADELLTHAGTLYNEELVTRFLETSN
jgi:excisionase family DNA binding protein